MAIPPPRQSKSPPIRSASRPCLPISMQKHWRRTWPTAVPPFFHFILA